MNAGFQADSQAPAKSDLARGFEVRATNPLDIPVLAALLSDSFAGGMAGQVWDETAMAEILAMPGAYGLIARAGEALSATEGGEPAGFLLANNVTGGGEILSLGVVRAWRRRGVARILVRAATDRARAAGVSRLFLEVAEDNIPARELYAAAGFKCIVRRPAYYRRGNGPAVSAMVLARDLG